MEKQPVEQNKTYNMYLNPELAFYFSKREADNESYQETTKIIERVTTRMLAEIAPKDFPFKVADLGAGAHPNFYNKLIPRLIDGNGRLDWVDASPAMITLAEHNLVKDKKTQFNQVINYCEEEITDYLSRMQKESDVLHAMIFKYTFDCITDLDDFFEKAKNILTPTGFVIATITTLGEIPQYSSNAGYFYKDQLVSKAGQKLEDGDRFTIKFLKEYKNPSAGFMEGAETEKTYFSTGTMIDCALKHGFSAKIAPWKKFDTQLPYDRDLTLAVFNKK